MSAPAIDPTPLYLLDDPEQALELLLSSTAWTPQSRRVAVLLGEAQAAGMGEQVTEVFTEWAGLLASLNHIALANVLAVARAEPDAVERPDSCSLPLGDVGRQRGGFSRCPSKRRVKYGGRRTAARSRA